MFGSKNQWMAVALVAASGCAIEAEELSTDESGLYGNQDFMTWAKTSGRTDINVCWVNPGNAPGANPTLRAAWRDARRRAVEESWARHARINFYGWDGGSPVDAPTSCTSTTSTGIHITICNKDSDTRCPKLPQSQNVVVQLNADGPVANVLFNQTHPASIMVHETGHSLGFYHAEERPDAPNIATGNCAKQSFPNSNPVLYGAYDKHSIMSYCEPFGDEPYLSANDIAGVQRAYGRRPHAMLATPRGNCAAAHAAIGTGDRGFVFDCDEANNDQEWIDTKSTTTGDGFNLAITQVASAAKFCLGADSATSGAAVKLQPCTTVNDWRFENMFVKGFGGRCLDVPGGNTTPGTALQMFECGALGGGNQRFSRTGSGQLRFGTTNSCVRLDPTLGRLVMATCNTGDQAQAFAFSAGNIKPLGALSTCLDVVGPSDEEFTNGIGLLGNGAQIGVQPCKGLTLNQRFHFSGGLKYDASANLCLKRGSDLNASQLSLATCSEAKETMLWDYYF